MEWQEGHALGSLWTEVPISVEEHDAWPLTKGDFVDVVSGVHRLRLDYPMMEWDARSGRMGVGGPGRGY